MATITLLMVTILLHTSVFPFVSSEIIQNAPLLAQHGHFTPSDPPSSYIMEVEERTYSVPELSSLAPASSANSNIIKFSSTSTSPHASTTTTSHTSSGIARCFFKTGNTNRDKSLSPFFIPYQDISMYEEGVKDYLSSLGVSIDTLRIECEDITKDDYNANQHVYKQKKFCKLCIYNEISEDRKHINQGQVLDTYLHECIFGSFMNRKKMQNSQYHPICYPPPPITNPPSSPSSSSPKLSPRNHMASETSIPSSRNGDHDSRVYSKSDSPFFQTTCRDVTPKPHGHVDS